MQRIGGSTSLTGLQGRIVRRMQAYLRTIVRLRYRLNARIANLRRNRSARISIYSDRTCVMLRREIARVQGLVRATAWQLRRAQAGRRGARWR